ncbi:sugar ABC transporter substrate-binding protein [Arachnia propionica]|uniref:Sugar ABC transporter substrate-binding protein n=1 Tax=Arachnia propionica TaxID=1750 RepID=A0A3P1TC06_9ACTN|nr:sugar ABC transporter substrate-binding protein [Arachnia propionica]RRD06013.1 sugar ABC transporter substrate-binding protein [Arachnia propionica]
MTKLVRAAAALALSAALAATGCAPRSDGDGGSGGDQKVTMWMYPVVPDEARHKELWDQMVSRFEQANPGIEVEIEFFPWKQRDEAIQTALTSRTAPDLIYLIPDQLAAYQKSIEPIDEHLGQQRVAELLPNAKEAVTLDGAMMGAPMLTSANPLLCNKAAFEKAGVTDYPSTWQDVIDIAPRFSENGMHAISYSAVPTQTLNLTFYPVLWQAGGTVFDDKRAAFDSPEGREALEYLTTLQQAGALDPDALTTALELEQTAFAGGRSGCAWDFAPKDLASQIGEENVVVLPPLKGKESVGYGTVGTIAMFKDAKNKEAAGKFAAFATDPANSVDFLTAAGYFSPVAGKGPDYSQDPILSEIEKTLPDMRFGELHPQARAVMGALAPEIQAALLGQKSPEQALGDAAAAAESIIGQP